MLARPATAQVQPVAATLTAASTGVCLPTNCLPFSVPSGVGSATFQIGGNTTFSGTVQFEVVLFDGSYYPLNANPAASSTAVTSATGPGSWQVNIAGFTTVRMRVTVLASGSVAAFINPSTASARSGGGSGGGGSGTVAPCGTSNALPVYTASTTVGCSLATDNGTTLAYSGTGGAAIDATVIKPALDAATGVFTVDNAAGTSAIVQVDTRNNGNGLVLTAQGGGNALNTSGPSRVGQTLFTSLVVIGTNAELVGNGSPTIAAAGCGGSGASIPNKNGTAAFQVNVGTSNTGTCTVTMPAGASTNWVCSATDITTTSANVAVTKAVPGGTPTTQITLQNYTDVFGTHAWTDSDVIEVLCGGE